MIGFGLFVGEDFDPNEVILVSLVIVGLVKDESGEELAKYDDTVVLRCVVGTLLLDEVNDDKDEVDGENNVVLEEAALNVNAVVVVVVAVAVVVVSAEGLNAGEIIIVVATPDEAGLVKAEGETAETVDAPFKRIVEAVVPSLPSPPVVVYILGRTPARPLAIIPPCLTRAKVPRSVPFTAAVGRPLIAPFCNCPGITGAGARFRGNAVTVGTDLFCC